MFKKSSGHSANREPELIVGLDLGTSKVTVVVAEREHHGDEAQIIGVGQAPSNGIRKGLIVNLDQAVRSVRQAVGDAQNMVGQDISEVTVAFGGGDVTSIRSTGMVSLGRSPRQVMQLDIERVIEAAQADVVIPANQTILHTIPVEYSLDGNVGIDDPLGMTGMRLDIQLQSVIVPTATIQNVLNCVKKAGLDVAGIVIKPLASALGALSPEEALAGGVVLDIGGGTTGIAVFSDGRPKYLGLVSIGGDHITNDVGSVLKLPLNKAEEIKKEVSVFAGVEDENETIDFAYNGRNFSISKYDLHEIVKCRIEELCDVLVRPEIKAAGISMLPAGIVVTGGVSKTEGIDAFLLDLMDLPARISAPVDANRMPPGRNTQEYTAASGIIRYVLEKERDPFRYLENPQVIDMKDREPHTLVPPLEKTPVKDGKEPPKERPGFNPFKSIGDVFKDLF
ncbi:cell division protein FtsA [Synergistaceae bacterium OttesenSCG-928-D05]|nr:cell division protein FtsA [Synergistaceae bacterium OttesenSCG-928-D05]